MVDLLQRDLIERKYDVCFGHGDQNDDGILEMADCIALGARVIAYLEEPFDSPKALELLRSFGRFWQHLTGKLDADHDGKITPEEFREGMRQAWIDDPGGFETAFRPAAQALWNLCDKNDNGTVGAEEFARFHKAFGTSEENSRISFERLDANGNGNLSVDELVNAWKEFYTSLDPEAPGNWLFGDIWEEDIWDGNRVKL